MGVNFNMHDIVPYFEQVSSLEEVQNKLVGVDLATPFVLIFPESGEPLKNLPLQFWSELADRIIAQTNYSILVCGQYPNTLALQTILKSKHTQRLHFLINQVTINDIARLATQASSALTLESFPAHYCAIFCNTITFCKNGSGYEFFPISAKKALIIHNDEKVFITKRCLIGKRITCPKSNVAKHII